MDQAEPDVPRDLATSELSDLVRAVVKLSEMSNRVLEPFGDPLVRRVRAHFEEGLDVVPNRAESFTSFEQANVQVALDKLRETSTSWEVIGLSPDIGHYSGLSLAGLASGTWQGPGMTAAQYTSVSTGVGEKITCLRAGIVLATLDGDRVALMVHTSERQQVEIVVEIVAPTDAIAERLLGRIHMLMDEYNVMRGKVLSFCFGRHGEFGITFVETPVVHRDQVILPEADLVAIERHAIGISEHRTALIEAGQHVKRGLLLYGPPGTGKTHTISYLLNKMSDRTTIVLSGAAVGAIGQAGSIARTLQPATIVIEDVDLIGLDRSLPGGDHNSILFQLLNEMDGLNSDADVLFILTTNRVELIEPALTARPGRIDQAIEIGLPSSAARRSLLELYTHQQLPTDIADAVVTKTAGVAAAFIKELARRASLLGIQAGRPVAECLEQALDELIHQSAPILRRSLAAPSTN